VTVAARFDVDVRKSTFKPAFGKPILGLPQCSGRPLAGYRPTLRGWQAGALAVSLTQAEFQRWVQDHGPSMYRMAYRLVGDRHEAEDLVQEAFRSAWKSRKLYDCTRGERAWLTAILRRRIVDYWRRSPNLHIITSDSPPEISIPGFDPLANDYTDEMQRALNTLPLELKETLLLVVVAELTHQEAADLLDVPLGTVLSRVSRARGRLREYLLNKVEH